MHRVRACRPLARENLLATQVLGHAEALVAACARLVELARPPACPPSNPPQRRKLALARVVLGRVEDAHVREEAQGVGHERAEPGVAPREQDARRHRAQLARLAKVTDAPGQLAGGQLRQDDELRAFLQQPVHEGVLAGLDDVAPLRGDAEASAMEKGAGVACGGK